MVGNRTASASHHEGCDRFYPLRLIVRGYAVRAILRGCFQRMEQALVADHADERRLPIPIETALLLAATQGRAAVIP